MILNDFRGSGHFFGEMQKNYRLTSGFACIAARGGPRGALLAQNVVFPMVYGRFLRFPTISRTTVGRPPAQTSPRDPGTCEIHFQKTSKT